MTGGESHGGIPDNKILPESFPLLNWDLCGISPI
jgi:hypothetical protein